MKSSTSKYWSKSHSSEKYEPWRTERAKFKKVKKWLRQTFGEEEKDSDQDTLNELMPDDPKKLSV